MIWSKSVIFCVPAVLVPSQLNLFPRFCILGEFDIFGNIGFFDCFKPNCVLVFLFVVDCLWLVWWLLLPSFGSFLVSIAGNFELSNGGLKKCYFPLTNPFYKPFEFAFEDFAFSGWTYTLELYFYFQFWIFRLWVVSNVFQEYQVYLHPLQSHVMLHEVLKKSVIIWSDEFLWTFLSFLVKFISLAPFWSECKPSSDSVFGIIFQ